VLFYTEKAITEPKVCNISRICNRNPLYDDIKFLYCDSSSQGLAFAMLVLASARN
jgi:hypothetical protein